MAAKYNTDMDSSALDAEAELERFREQWREEVSRSKRTGTAAHASSYEIRSPRRKDGDATQPAGPSTARRRDILHFSEEVEPRAYHDLPDKEELLKLGVEGQNHDRDPNKEPSSALEHYEHAVERETQGQLGDSIKHYRRAFKVRATATSHSFLSSMLR